MMIVGYTVLVKCIVYMLYVYISKVCVLQCLIMNAEKNETLWSTDVDMTNYYSSGKLSYMTHDVETGSPVHYQVIMVSKTVTCSCSAFHVGPRTL